MSESHRLRIAALIVSGAFIAACSPESAAAPKQSPLSLNQVLGLTAVPYFVGGASAASYQARLVPSECAYDSPSKVFVCPDASVGNLRITRSFNLANAAGPQSQFDPGTTSIVETSARITGVDTSQGAVRTTDAREDLRLTGLLTSAHVLSGGTIEHVSVVGGSSPHSTTSTRMLRNVTFAPAIAWPTSGSIDIDILDEGGDLTGGSVHMQIVFNGTSKALWTTTSNGPTRRCTYDLTGRYDAVCSQ